MSTRSKKTDTYGPAAFVQLSMPFWEAVLETDTPNFVFQPVKALALGQIQTADLINKRCQACLELPQKLAACRSPEDFIGVNQSFLQSAMRDYSNAVQAMTSAWDKAIAEQADGEARPKVRHDYLPLPTLKPEADETTQQVADNAQNATSRPTQHSTQPNGAIGHVRPKNRTQTPHQ